MRRTPALRVLTSRVGGAAHLLRLPRRVDHGDLRPLRPRIWVGNFDGVGNPALVGVQMAAPLFFQLVDAVEAEDRSLAEPVRSVPAGLSIVDVYAASGDLPNADCPRTVPTWFIPGKSPIQVSTLHQALLIDDETGLLACPPYTTGPAHRVVYELWGSGMLKLFQQAGLPRRTYTVRAKRLGRDIITLCATTGASVRGVYWFVGRSFIGRSPPQGEPRLAARGARGVHGARRGRPGSGRCASDRVGRRALSLEPKPGRRYFSASSPRHQPREE